MPGTSSHDGGKMNGQAPRVALVTGAARGIGLTTPERAVLLAYCKMWLFDEILASDLPEDPWIGTALGRYFPGRLREQFCAYIPRHPLKREIVATHVLNSMVNRVGPSFVHALTESTGATAAQVVRAYLLTREVFGFVPTWEAIEVRLKAFGRSWTGTRLGTAPGAPAARSSARSCRCCPRGCAGT